MNEQSPISCPIPRDLAEYDRARSALYSSLERPEEFVNLAEMKAKMSNFVEVFKGTWVMHMPAFDLAVLEALERKRAADSVGMLKALCGGISHIVESPQLCSFGPDTRFCIPFLDEVGSEVLLQFFDLLERRSNIDGERIKTWKKQVGRKDRQALRRNSWAYFSLSEDVGGSSRSPGSAPELN